METVILLTALICIIYILLIITMSRKELRDKLNALSLELHCLQCNVERKFESEGNQLYQIDGMVSDIEDSLCGVSLRDRLNRLPEHIYVEDNCYTLNIHIHNDGVNLDYCDGIYELFSIGQSYNEDCCDRVTVLNKILDEAFNIINKELWKNEE